MSKTNFDYREMERGHNREVTQIALNQKLFSLEKLKVDEAQID